eukprot:scaffold546945_cov389-Attheya_sp.AAC.1
MGKGIGKFGLKILTRQDISISIWTSLYWISFCICYFVQKFPSFGQITFNNKPEAEMLTIVSVPLDRRHITSGTGGLNVQVLKLPTKK